MMSDAKNLPDEKPQWRTRLVKGEFPDRDFDVRFWQEQGDEAIFRARYTKDLDSLGWQFSPEFGSDLSGAGEVWCPTAERRCNTGNFQFRQHRLPDRRGSSPHRYTDSHHRSRIHRRMAKTCRKYFLWCSGQRDIARRP